MNIHKVNWTWSSRCQDTEIVALREERIKRAQSIRGWMVPARDVCLHAEARFQRRVCKSIASFSSDRPRSNVSRTKRAELPQSFIVKVPPGSLSGNGTRYSSANRVTNLLSRAALECGLLSIQPQVVQFY